MTLDKSTWCKGTTPAKPVPKGYKACPECGKLLLRQGYGGHLYGIHGIRTGVEARLRRVESVVDRLVILVRTEDITFEQGKPPVPCHMVVAKPKQS